MKKLMIAVVVGVLLLLIVPTVGAQGTPDSPDGPVAACAAAYILPLLAIGFVTVKETAPPLASKVSPCAIWTAVLIVVVGIGLFIAGIVKE